jgi:hypothetical protein
MLLVWRIFQSAMIVIIGLVITQVCAFAFSELIWEPYGGRGNDLMGGLVRH